MRGLEMNHAHCLCSLRHTEWPLFILLIHSTLFPAHPLLSLPFTIFPFPSNCEDSVVRFRTLYTKMGSPPLFVDSSILSLLPLCLLPPRVVCYLFFLFWSHHMPLISISCLAYLSLTHRCYLVIITSNIFFFHFWHEQPCSVCSDPCRKPMLFSWAA